MSMSSDAISHDFLLPICIGISASLHTHLITIKRGVKGETFQSKPIAFFIQPFMECPIDYQPPVNGCFNPALRRYFSLIFKPNTSLESSFLISPSIFCFLWIEQNMAEWEPFEICRCVDFAIDQKLRDQKLRP